MQLTSEDSKVVLDDKKLSSLFDVIKVSRFVCLVYLLPLNHSFCLFSPIQCLELFVCLYMRMFIEHFAGLSFFL